MFMSPIKELSDTEAAYVAGIIDGEGTIGLTRLHSGENRRPVVSVSSTERPLLEYIKSIVGAGRITNKACSSPHHSPSFAYVVVNRQALAVLQRVKPFLRTYKAERARLLLDEYLKVTPRNGRYTDAQLKAKRDFEVRFLAVQMRARNKPREPGTVPPVNTCEYEDRNLLKPSRARSIRSS